MSSRVSNTKKLTALSIKRALFSVASLERAEINAWFFKTGKGEYGEGDEFIGVSVPDIRKVAKQFQNLSFIEITRLLQSKKHEHRLAGVLILVFRYEKGNEVLRKKIVQFYIKNIDRINNWDLVDLSAPKILGAYYLEYGGHEHFYSLARSKNIWERRIAIVGTLIFIQRGIFGPTLQISEILLTDTEDLLHKATGWMLREVGKRDKKVLVIFLSEHSANMPRTSLRYAIEHFSKNERKKWLHKKSNILRKRKI